MLVLLRELDGEALLVQRFDDLAAARCWAASRGMVALTAGEVSLEVDRLARWGVAAAGEAREALAQMRRMSAALDLMGEV